MSQPTTHDALAQLVRENEEWLMERILDYARRTGFTDYTSTLKEAWRLSISGITSSILLALNSSPDIPDLTPQYHYGSDPVSLFGITEAKNHRKRGISLAMFSGLFKYYRQSYLDLVEEKGQPELDKAWSSRFIQRIFDIIEIAFCVEWSGGDPDRQIHQLQVMNRQMTNEKNKYLTIFESLPSPAIIARPDGLIDNLNRLAMSYFNAESGVGGYYYKNVEHTVEDSAELPYAAGTDTPSIETLFPWLADEFRQFASGNLDRKRLIKHIEIYKKPFTFRVRFSEIFDVSRKFSGIVIVLEDITRLEQVEA